MRSALVVLAILVLGATVAELAKQAPKAKPAPSVVKVTLKEWSIKVDPDKVKAGAIRFDISNTGTAVHALAIDGIKDKTKNIKPEGKASLTVTLKAGKYTLYCPVDNHRKEGMETKLTVTK